VGADPFLLPPVGQWLFSYTFSPLPQYTVKVRRGGRIPFFGGNGRRGNSPLSPSSKKWGKVTPLPFSFSTYSLLDVLVLRLREISWTLVLFSPSLLLKKLSALPFLLRGKGEGLSFFSGCFLSPLQKELLPQRWIRTLVKDTLSLLIRAVNFFLEYLPLWKGWWLRCKREGYFFFFSAERSYFPLPFCASTFPLKGKTEFHFFPPPPNPQTLFFPRNGSFSPLPGKQGVTVSPTPNAASVLERGTTSPFPFSFPEERYGGFPPWRRWPSLSAFQSNTDSRFFLR